jgi:hypothetical protein
MENDKQSHQRGLETRWWWKQVSLAFVEVVEGGAGWEQTNKATNESLTRWWQKQVPLKSVSSGKRRIKPPTSLYDSLVVKTDQHAKRLVGGGGGNIVKYCI